jgi:hypothetical protein
MLFLTDDSQNRQCPREGGGASLQDDCMINSFLVKYKIRARVISARSNYVQ